jgi:hypothetical protein
MLNSDFPPQRNHRILFAIFPLITMCVLLVGNRASAGEYVSINDIISGKNVAHPPAVEPARESQWRISAGAIWRDIGDVRFHTGSHSQRLRLPNLVGREFRHLPTAAGPLGTIAPRNYRDGFVHTDAGTANDGFTWNWGYDESSQVQGDQLVYSLAQGSQRTVSRRSSLSDASWQDDSEFEPGPYIEIDRLFPLSERVLVGPQFNFSFIRIDSQQAGSTFAQHQSSEQRSFQLTDRFDLDGVIPPLAPYAGTEAGPGPLINNLPSSRSLTSFHRDSRTADFFNRVDESFDLDLFTLGAGAHIEYDLDKVFIQGSAGLALNVADWEASHRETLYVSRDGGKAESYRNWTARESGTDLLLGAYVQTKVGVQLTERLSVSGFARYDWSQSLTGNVGPSSFDVGLDGLSAGVMVGFTF